MYGCNAARSVLRSEQEPLRELISVLAKLRSWSKTARWLLTVCRNLCYWLFLSKNGPTILFGTQLTHLAVYTQLHETVTISYKSALHAHTLALETVDK